MADKKETKGLIRSSFQTNNKVVLTHEDVMRYIRMGLEEDMVDVHLPSKVYINNRNSLNTIEFTWINQGEDVHRKFKKN